MNTSSFYKSREWESFRATLMMERVNEEGQLICEYCGRPILKPYDCIAHHEIELTDDNVNDFTISLNPEHIKLIHFKCHNKIHQRFIGFYQNVYLVYGSPCSGKRTWVQSNSYDDDLIVDVDRIWKMIQKGTEKSSRLKAVVFGIRDNLIDQIRMRKGTWRNAFVIGGYPLRSDRDRLCELLRAKPIYIEATEEECLSRCDESMKEYIHDWFEEHT